MNPYTNYDIESGQSITSLRTEFINFKNNMLKEINEIKKVTHPSLIDKCASCISEWGFIASYIILWLIVFHKM